MSSIRTEELEKKVLTNDIHIVFTGELENGEIEAKTDGKLGKPKIGNAFEGPPALVKDLTF